MHLAYIERDANQEVLGTLLKPTVYPGVYDCLLCRLVIQKVIDLDFFILVLLVVLEEPGGRVIMQLEIVLSDTAVF